MGAVAVVVRYMELATRRVICFAVTERPDADWVSQQARNLCWDLAEIGVDARFLVHDHDAKYGGGSDLLFKAEGIEVIRTPIAAPKANAHIERHIAWENLFGTSEGEPTLRVTAALAILLEPDLDKREVLCRDLNAIYRLRSKFVHGSYELSVADGPLCQTALDIALRTLRVLAIERVDVLEKPDGGERSLYVILRG